MSEVSRTRSKRESERERTQFTVPKKVVVHKSSPGWICIQTERNEARSIIVARKPIFTSNCKRLSAHLCTTNRGRVSVLSLIYMMREPTKATSYFQSLPLTRLSPLPPISRSMTNTHGLRNLPRETLIDRVIISRIQASRARFPQN